jgi:heat shock protein HtpX
VRTWAASPKGLRTPTYAAALIAAVIYSGGPLHVSIADELKRLGLGAGDVAALGRYLRVDGRAIDVLRPRLRSLRERAAYLVYLRRMIRREDYNVAVVGAWKNGRLVEPPEFKINPLLYLLPFLFSIPPALAVKHLGVQLAAGLSAIFISYFSLYFYLRGKCIRPDYVAVIKTRSNDVEYIRRHKEEVLKNPDALGEYEAYFFRGNICLTKDKAANALSYEIPFGKLVIATTGLLAKLKPEELEAALRHEEGHLKYHHMYKLLLFMMAEYTLRVYLIDYVYADISLFLIGLHLLGASLLYTSLLRFYEYEADFYAASDALARALLKIGWSDVVDQVLYPAYSKLQFLVKTHPNTLDRVLKIWSWSGTWRSR